MQESSHSPGLPFLPRELWTEILKKTDLWTCHALHDFRAAASFLVTDDQKQTALKEIMNDQDKLESVLTLSPQYDCFRELMIIWMTHWMVISIGEIPELLKESFNAAYTPEIFESVEEIDQFAMRLSKDIATKVNFERLSVQMFFFFRVLAAFLLSFLAVHWLLLF